MSAIIISNKDKKYHEFVLEMLEALEEYDVKGIAVVALTDSDNISGYWNMNLYDKIKAKTEIEFDCIDNFIKTNKERYLNEEE